MIGEEIKYLVKNKTGDSEVTGKVIDVAPGNPLFNIKTGKTNSDTLRLRIQPNNGGRPFWTTSMVRHKPHKASIDDSRKQCGDYPQDERKR